jgi:hypothetical protein
MKVVVDTEVLTLSHSLKINLTIETKRGATARQLRQAGRRAALRSTCTVSQNPLVSGESRVSWLSRRVA